MLSLAIGLSASSASSQTFFPDTGREALYQRALDVQGRLTVLSLALQPGYEDLSALAYFRMARGAKILSAYLTNGEAGESDTLWTDPHQLAGTRRLEATRAIAAVGGDVFFLNFPDIATARNLASVRRTWAQDSVQAGLVRVIRDFRPDLILVSRDRGAFGSRSFRWEAFKEDVIKAAKMSGLATAQKNLLDQSLATTPWHVNRVWIDDGSSGNGTDLPTGQVHPVVKNTYQEIADKAGQAYASLKFQRFWWTRGPADRSRYVLASSVKGPAKVTPAGSEAALVTKTFRSLDNQITALTGRVMASAKASKRFNAKPLLGQLTAIMDSLDVCIARSFAYSNAERRLIVDWKLGLERLRTALLGVTVRYAISETALTQLQLSFLVIDTVTGMSAGGKTELYFPQKDWIINERHDLRWPLEFRKDYRLLSPAVLDYNWPIEQLGLNDAMTTQSLLVYIIHQATRREESFVYKIDQPMYYTPRFTTEVLTPLVRVVPDECVAVRLTNHSRDGIKDILHVDDSLVTSNQSEFRLNKKEQSHLDTLRLQWKRDLETGTYVFPVMIGYQEVSRFAARKFDVHVDSSKRIGLISGMSRGATSESLRRLGLRFMQVTPDTPADTLARRLDVLIVDHRFTSFGQDSTLKSVLKRFAEQGGHVVMFSQDAVSWNASPLVEGLLLKRTTFLDEETEVGWDTTQTLLMSPNKLTSDDWNGWLFARGHNRISGSALPGGEIPVWTAGGRDPLVVTRVVGKGRITYVDLALEPQLLNIHPGAFRILANLLAY
ncbi:MAG: PIG-L family deacetylase [Bacteroidota bacterium]